MQRPKAPFTLSDFDYRCRPDLIGFQPTSAAQAALLHVAGPVLADLRFVDLPLVARGDLMVFNDARDQGTSLRRRPTGGQVGCCSARDDGDEAVFQLRASHPLSRAALLLPGNAGRRSSSARAVRRCAWSAGPPSTIWSATVSAVAAVYRPCRQRRRRFALSNRARHPGATAAPTAGFSTARARFPYERRIAIAYVTLHVGAGTFQP
jgi:S-adenosylmethionine:tRNA ribosyltransferase-isomerase